jgi:hypothetical protein
MLEDYLAVGDAMIERIRDQVGALAFVGAASDLATVQESQQTTPAAFVVYQGDRIADDAGEGERTAVDQQWLVWLMVRNARQARTGDGVRQEAGPVLSSLIAALSGWKPLDGLRAFKRVNAPRPLYSKAAGYFPLMFTTRVFT